MRISHTSHLSHLIALPYQATAVYRPIVTQKVGPMGLSFLVPGSPNTAQNKSQKKRLQPPLYFCSNFQPTLSTNRDETTPLIQEDPAESFTNCPLSNKAAFHFEMEGILKRSSNGHYYLEVDHSFLSQLTPYLPEGANLEPNAHIGVVMPHEYEKYRLWKQVKEVGKKFYFGVIGFYTVDLINHSQYSKIWGLKIYSPALEELRESYNLSAKIRGHDFFLVVGSQERGYPTSPLTHFKINPGVHKM